MSLRLRFAPSPTGFLHVGGARTALFNWLLARRHGGAFILRIEDTDRARSTEAFTDAILDGMRWLGLDWDEGPLFQADGLERHRTDAERLLEDGKAYRDFTDPGERGAGGGGEQTRYERIELDEAESRRRAEAGEPFAIRFRVPEGETAWDDLVHGGMRFDNAEIEDLVLLRRDGTPTYNLAVVSDDIHMAITDVIRGDDHLSNTPKQILLYEALGAPLPRFGHVPMILGPDGKRLSKRHGAVAVGAYADEGILPAAMVNFLALLGWSPGDDREVMALPELIEAFSADRILKKSAVFDTDKLTWLNGQHLAAMPFEELAVKVRPSLERALGAAAPPEELLRPFLELLAGRARTLDDLAGLLAPYLTRSVEYEAEAVEKHWARAPAEVADLLTALEARLEATPWTAETLEAAVRGLAAEREIGAGKVIHPLRLALTGSGVSPGIFEVLVALGKDRSLERIRVAVSSLQGSAS